MNSKKKMYMMSFITGLFLLGNLYYISKNKKAFQGKVDTKFGAISEFSMPRQIISSGTSIRQPSGTKSGDIPLKQTSSPLPLSDIHPSINPGKQDVNEATVNEHTQAILNKYPTFGEISKLFSSSESMSKNPELVSWINQILIGTIIDPSDHKKYADFVFNINIDSITDKAMVTFDIMEPNDNFGRYDSKNSHPDKLFRFIRQNKKISVLIGFEEQWYAHLVIDLEGSADTIIGKFYRNDGFIGEIQPNGV